MNNTEKTQMKKLGITCSTQSMYHYKNYRPNKLSDTIDYAKTDSNRKLETSELETAIVSDNG